MSLAETYHHENMHARWVHNRRHMVMTRVVCIVLLMTSGLVMHTTYVKAGNDAMGHFNQSTISENR